MLRVMDKYSEEYLSQEIEVWIYGRKIKGKRKLIIEDQIKKIFWITYRSGFPCLDSDTQLTSDKGWGCMIRCGQMMLANAFAMLNETSEPLSIESQNEILKKFQDDIYPPFSIHSIVKVGKTQNVQVGKWFGPNIICHSLSKILNEKDYGLKMHIVVDFMLNTKEISNMMKREPPDNNGSFQPILIIIPYTYQKRESSDKLINYVSAMFEQPTFAGMLGGVSTQALYFYGKSDQNLLFLDPHTTRKYQILMDDFRNSCVYSKINLKKINKIGLSFALSFLFKTLKSFDDWCIVMKEIGKDFISITDATVEKINNSNKNATGSINPEKIPSTVINDYAVS